MASTHESLHPLLVTTDWLADHLDSPEFVLIDCGEPAAYRRGHIPGAVPISHAPFLKGESDPRLVMDAGEFEPVARSLGISNDTPVIVYDDAAALLSARVWWVFERFGHRDVRVLDGGASAWVAEERPLTSLPSQNEPGTFTAAVDESHHCRIEEMRAAVESEGVQVWDTRTEAEWTGANDRGNARAGHVPGAVWLEWRQLLEDPPTQRFRPLDEISGILAAAGIDPEAETVTY